MILSIDQCKERLGVFDDTPELLGWLEDMIEEEDHIPTRYNLQEIRQNLAGLYELARSMNAHLFALGGD